MEGKDEMKTEHSWEQSTETFQLKEQKPSSFQTYPTLTENSKGSTITKYSSKNPGSHSHYEAHNNHKEPGQQETKPSLALLDKVSEKYILSWFLFNIGEKYGGYTKIIAIFSWTDLSVATHLGKPSLVSLTQQARSHSTNQKAFTNFVPVI